MHQFLRRKEMSIPGERKPVVVLTSPAVCELCSVARFLLALLFLSLRATFLCISISYIPTVLSPLLLLCSLRSPSLGFLSSLTLSSLCFLLIVSLSSLFFFSLFFSFSSLLFSPAHLCFSPLYSPLSLSFFFLSFVVLFLLCFSPLFHRLSLAFYKPKNALRCNVQLGNGL